MSDKQRADALAAVIHDLCGLVTTDHESKADFIVAVKNVLGTDPDLRVSALHDRIKRLEQELAEIKQQFIKYENSDAYELDMMIEYVELKTMIMNIKESSK